MNAADYRTALKTFTSDNYWKKIRYVLREQLSANIRKDFPTGFVVVEFLTHRPVKLLKAPPADNTVLQANYVMKLKGINKVKGQPFTVYEIVDGVKKLIAGG